MPEEKPDPGSMIEGVLVAAAATLLAAALFFVSRPAAQWSIILVLFCGLAQFIYLAPLIFAFWHFGRTEAAKGVVIVAAVVFLLNATCYGLVFSGKLNVGL